MQIPVGLDHFLHRFAAEWSFPAHKGPYGRPLAMLQLSLHNRKGGGHNMRLICLDLRNKGIQIGCDLEILFAPLARAGSSTGEDDVSLGPQLALAILGLLALSVLVTKVCC